MSKILIKTPDEIRRIKLASQLTSKILDEVGEIVRPGISTEEINTFVHNMILANDAVPATLNYKGYPKSVCTSINDVICHGIPNPYEILKAGDIVNIDVTCIKEGCYGDASRMYMVGGSESCSAEAVDLVKHTRLALYKGIEAVRPGASFSDIGAAIQDYVKSTGKNYGIVRDYTGHGVGREFHEPPQILHVGKKGFGEKMKAGMTFTIEPMINLGDYRTILSNVDGWTVRTVDGSLSAQWEHTILVTQGGHEILTFSHLEKALVY